MNKYKYKFFIKLQYIVFYGIILFSLNCRAGMPPKAPSVQNNQGPSICNPDLKIEDWAITPKTWGQGDMDKARTDPNSLLKQFKTDIIVYYNSLFPSNKRQQAAMTCTPRRGTGVCKDPDVVLEQDRQNFLKRIFLAMADAPLKYASEENNSIKLSEWPYPLAVALSHGQRIIFDIKGTKDANSFYNLLLTGDETMKPKIDMTRIGASHGFDIKDSKIQEKNLKGIKNLGANLKIGLQGNHRGVNLAIGGFGNLDKNGLEIAPQGFRYDPKTDKILHTIQHGHAYLQVKSFAKNRSALMVGVEGSMPCSIGSECRNMYGIAHTAKGGFVSSEKLPSITGGEKMQPLLKNRGCAAPAPYGGMWIKVNQEYFIHLNLLFNVVLKMSNDDQKELFKELLKSNGADARMILQKRFPGLYPSKQVRKGRNVSRNSDRQ